MKRQNFLLLSISTLCLMVMAGCQGAAVPPAPFPKVCYTASYAMTDHGVTYDWGKISSDGKGHIFVCRSTMVTVEDYAQNNEIVQDSPYNPQLVNRPILLGNYVTDGELTNEKLYLWRDAIRRRNWTPIQQGRAIVYEDQLVANGEKVVDRHDCRGWVFTSNDPAVGQLRDELWFDKDTDVLVREDCTRPHLYPGSQMYSTSLRLKNFSNVALPAEAFILPIRDPKLWTELTAKVAKSPWAPDDPRSHPLTYTDAKLKDYIEEKPAPKEPSARTQPVGQTPTHTGN